MTNDKAIHAAILAGFKRANIGRMHFRMAAIIEADVADRERERCANACIRFGDTLESEIGENFAEEIRAMNDEVEK